MHVHKALCKRTVVGSYRVNRWYWD